MAKRRPPLCIRENTTGITYCLAYSRWWKHRMTSYIVKTYIEPDCFTVEILWSLVLHVAKKRPKPGPLCPLKCVASGMNSNDLGFLPSSGSFMPTNVRLENSLKKYQKIPPKKKHVWGDLCRLTCNILPCSHDSAQRVAPCLSPVWNPSPRGSPMAKLHGDETHNKTLQRPWVR